MALVKQIVPISLQLGLETKADEKQEDPNRLLRAENIVYESINKLRKRNGYDCVSTRLIDDSMLTDLKALDRFKLELLAFSKTKLNSFSDSIDRWVEKGSVYNVFADSTPIARNAYEQTELDCEFRENLKISTWTDSNGGVRYSVMDRDTGSFLVSDDEVSATGDRSRIGVINNFIFIFFADGTDLKYRRFNVLNPGTLDSEVTAQSNLDGTSSTFDVVNISSKIFIGYNSTAATKLAIFNIDADETISSVSGLSGQDCDNAIHMSTDGADRVIINWADSTDVKYAILSFNLLISIVSATTIETIASVKTISHIEKTCDEYVVYYEIGAASTVDHYVKKVTTNATGTVGTPAVFLRSVGLASTTFLQDSQVFAVLIHESTLQSTYFVADEAGTIVTRVSPNIGGEVMSHGVLSKTQRIDDNEILISTQIKGRNVVEESVFFSLLGANSTVLKFEETSPFQTAHLGDNLHISGGLIQMYDGDEVVEHGFHVFPEDLAAGTNSASGGALDDGTRGYKAVYAWTDNYGQLHRSAPSLTLNTTQSAGGSAQTQDITVPTLRLTSKPDAIIELYRTEDAGTIYHKVTSINAPEFNDTTVDSITITDDISDTALLSLEVLYTTGGVLENIAAPSSSIIATFNNRVAVVQEGSHTIVFSKLRAQNGPVEFTDIITRQIDPVGGEITAAITMDDKFIVFEDSAMFYISGDGPNNLGLQDTFIEPEIISSDVGCVDPNSLVLTPSGVMFKSRKGIYLLGRGLQVSYIGAAVEEFNDLTITSAEIIPDFNQVRFLTNDGHTLVYNFQLNLWATFTNHEGQSAIVIDDDYYYLRKDGAIYQENKTSFSDAGSPIKLRLETVWLSFAGLQGFQRVYKMFVLGEYKSPHKLLTRFAYNFIDAYTQEQTIDTSDFADDARYGEDSPYGDPSTKAYGGTGNQYQARIDLKTQKCESVKILIEDIQDTVGEAMSISALTFEVGGKQGPYKINANQKYGSQ